MLRHKDFLQAVIWGITPNIHILLEFDLVENQALHEQDNSEEVFKHVVMGSEVENVQENYVGEIWRSFLQNS